ncbi:alanine racemase [Sporobacter termitidis DSM 10068]|uniref:Alanine racemase n=1 Tax=Sporobacter termitidis DSM 10068 TaxID=1123282 RepID=A0A1M5Z8B0_9FIRM|nr:alanine racemase [Sporobacter termitidis]SHI20133.1 alanine racemase [Sporobacter termitidis DSM 10068]
MKYLVIDRRVVRNNLKAIKERADGAAIYADLSANACGMGLLEIAKLLRDDGIHAYAVSDPKDAAFLRSNGFTDERLMMLRSTADPEELSELIDLNVICTVGSYDAAVAINGIAESRKTVAEVQLKVDTGLGRYGFLPEETDKMASIFKYMSSLAIIGMFSTYAGSWRSKKLTLQQYEEFNKVLDRLTELGFETGVAHICDSAALFRYEFGRMDAVRVDTALSGRMPGKSVQGLSRVGYIEAGIEEVGWFPKGHRIGGDHGLVTKKPTKIAVLSVGYYHGFGVDRHLGEHNILELLRRRRRKLFVKIGGQRAHVLGEVGLLHTIIDVTHIECAVGDSVILDVDPVNVKGLPIMYL